jgi:predicted transcriptional regulator
MVERKSYTTVRISSPARETLRGLAEAAGKPMQAVLEDAIEALRRERFLREVNAAYAQIRRDPQAWASVEREREAWDVTLLDGLELAEPRGPYRSGRRRRAPK